MKIWNTYIELEEMRFHAFHGVLEQERRVGGDFVINLRLNVDGIDDALNRDELDDTVDYAKVYTIVEHEMKQPSQLLEHLAHRLAEVLFAEFPKIEAISMQIKKLAPPIPSADCAAAAFTMEVER